MNPEPLEDAIFAVRDASTDLHEAIDRLPLPPGNHHSGLRLEAERFLLGLAANVLIADGRLREREIQFLTQLFPDAANTDGANRVVECAEAWSADAGGLPRFFQIAAEHCPDEARLMLRMIQIVGNNATVVDGRVCATEHEVVRSCILRMESILS